MENKLSRSQSLGKIGEKKKPLPRPPPPKAAPKFTQNNGRKQPSQLLSSLFNRKSGRSKNGNSLTGQLTDPSNLQSGALIDLISPPSSPTLTIPQAVIVLVLIVLGVMKMLQQLTAVARRVKVGLKMILICLWLQVVPRQMLQTLGQTLIHLLCHIGLHLIQMCLQPFMN